MSDKGRGGVWAHVGVCPATREEGCGGREGIGWGGGSASDRGGNRYRRKESQRLSVDSEVRLKCGKALVRLVRRKGAAHSYFGSTKTLDPPPRKYQDRSPDASLHWLTWLMIIFVLFVEIWKVLWWKKNIVNSIYFQGWPQTCQ